MATQPPADSSECVPVVRENTPGASPTAVTREALYVTTLPFANPYACSEAQSSSPSAAGDGNVSTAADTEEADGRRREPQTFPSASAPPFQASTSHDASSSSSSAEGASTSAVPTQDAPASDGPSFSFRMELRAIEKISKDIVAVVEEIDNVNLEDLTRHILKLLELMKENVDRRSTDHHWPKSSGFSKLKRVVSKAIEAASSSKDTRVVPNLLKGIGQAHWGTVGLVVVLNVLESFDGVPVNGRHECLGLLDKMYKVAEYVKQLTERPVLSGRMGDLINEALEMIMEVAITCRKQTKPSYRFFSYKKSEEERLKLEQKLEGMCKDLKSHVDRYAIYCSTVGPPTLEPERKYADYAVGIEKVVELLEWESEKKSVAVILYGRPKVGKSTLANAVYGSLYIPGCKYSTVRLFDGISSTPNIVEKQKCILTDLMKGTAEGTTAKPDIRMFEHGRQEIGHMLEKEVAFIYIDNVLDGDLLQQLLPTEMCKAKKVRLLITARNKNVLTRFKIETKFYPMTGLPSWGETRMNEWALGGSQFRFGGYDVFINHRGPDTKKTFSSYLYHRLVLHGLKPFLDQRELQEGHHFPSQITDAIRCAYVHVAIFSPRYAESPWCLEELCLMQKSPAPIIPVFYGVKPTELRWTDQNKNGVYAKALHQLQEKKTDDSAISQEKSRHDSSSIQNWRVALSNVADISGFDLHGKFNGDEGLMLEKVVERVLKAYNEPGMYVAEDPEAAATTYQ